MKPATNGRTLRPLSADRLRRDCPLAAIGFRTTNELQGPAEILGQDRVEEALSLGVGIEKEGYNVVALGPEGMGKQTMLRQFLERHAAGAPRPDDWCYVMNWKEPARPRALSLPAGRGRALKERLDSAVTDLCRSIPVALAGEEHRTRKQRLDRSRDDQREAVLAPVRAHATEQGISLTETETGLVLETEQDVSLEPLEREIEALFGQLLEIDQRYQDALRALESELFLRAAHEALRPVRTEFADLPEVVAFLAQLERDVGEHWQEPDEDSSRDLYRINLVIDNSGLRGAPMVYDDEPTASSLVGQVQQISQLGSLVTDFSLIRGGSLHRARDGYLLVDLAKLIERPLAWKALKRALRTHQVKPRPPQATVSPRLEAQPIPLGETKVILLGERSLYEAMLAAEPDFWELFKVVAEFAETMSREGAEGRYARTLGLLAGKLGLRPFENRAIARIVEESARLAEHADKLSLHMRPLADLLTEAEYRARRRRGRTVTARDVEAALADQRRRAGRIWEHGLELIRRHSVVLETSGERVGRVNALEVIQSGASWFGLPNRVSARVWRGRSELTDVERETNLGGPIHSKGVLILRAYLAGRYGARKALRISSSVVFEQSYSLIEGDSASLAELCALLSALAECPARQCLAVTGSVNQYGEVQAVGGINEKVEGFFELCRQRGLTGQQGVILPADNVQNLMLDRTVVQAARAGKFHIYAVHTVDQAVELLMPGQDLDRCIRDRQAIVG